MADSSTLTVELHDLPASKLFETAPDAKPGPPTSPQGHRLGSKDDDESAAADDTGITGPEPGLPAPTTAAPVVEKWNYPRSNMYRIGATFFSFLVMGANDAAYGALIPYLERYYDLSYIVVSLVFLSPFVGYVLSAAMINLVHLKLGQRGIAMLCGGCHLAAYIVICLHPPYPVLVLAYILAGYGNGLADAAWNAWVGNLSRANEVLGFLHAVYGVGGVVAPLVATTMITQAHVPWYTFYYVMIGLAVLEIITGAWAFWRRTAAVYRETVSHGGSDSSSSGGMKLALITRPYARITWICSVFLLAYVGIEVSLGGWIVQFMLRVRDAEPFDAGMTSVGFWLGLTLGRVVLGFVTPRLGVSRALIAYVVLTMALELVFWLVPQFFVSAVAVALQGFFLGPIFPTVIVAATHLLPRHLHVSAIGFAAAFGSSGAAVLPFAVGAIAQAKGVAVLQPIILALLVVLLGLWLCLPSLGGLKKED